MAQVLVRNLPDDIVARLKERARARQRSLEAELRDILTEAAKPDRAEFIRWAREFRRKQKVVVGPDSLEILRVDRTRDR